MRPPLTLSRVLATAGALLAGAITLGMATPASATCNVSVPMLQSINCAAYPPSLQGFCSKYKPFLMHSGECKDAESDAQSREFGPRRDQCERPSRSEESRGGKECVI